jgi:hypothetical protein
MAWGGGAGGQNDPQEGGEVTDEAMAVSQALGNSLGNYACKRDIKNRMRVAGDPGQE